MALHGTPEITRELNAVLAEMRGGTAAYKRLIERVKHYMPAKLDEMAAEHAADRDGASFGLSGAGGCVRKAQIGALGTKTDFSPGKLFTFAIGHLLEPFALAILEEAGWKIHSTQAEVLIPGDYGQPLFHSWTDGIVGRDDPPYVLSVKTMGMKSSALFRGKATRRGFTALPLEGASESWRAQSQLEMYGLGIDRALVVVLSKEYMEVFETEDPIMQENGSAVIWTDVLHIDRPWIEGFVLPTWKRAQADLIAGRLSPGAALDKATGTYRPLDPRTDNKKAGWDWDRCKWSTGACDMRKECMAAFSGGAKATKAKEPYRLSYSAQQCIDNGDVSID